MDNLFKQDSKRYHSGKMPVFQKYFRKYQDSKFFLVKSIYRILYLITKSFYNVEISPNIRIGGGLYIGHPYCITMNSQVVIGKNCNIHKGVTIGQENRGIRKGAPSIGDCVWIGVNATIVGKITIGDDVLIAPNSFVNQDVPSHSVVFGNPCVIKHNDNATEGYVNNKI